MLDNSANVSAVNNDGELAIDISESDEMEEILQKEIDKQGINCDESRNTEERLMLEDARSWVNGKIFGDVPHNKTGATALHVAAAKGYIKVMGLLIQSGASVNSQVNCLVKSKLVIAKQYRTATFSRILCVLNFCTFFS